EPRRALPHAGRDRAGAGSRPAHPRSAPSRRAGDGDDSRGHRRGRRERLPGSEAEATVVTDLERFVAERSPRWRRLEALLDEAHEMPESALGRPRLHELLLLYRSACADLNQARALTANPQLLGTVNQLVGRAYRFIYRRRRGSG